MQAKENLKISFGLNMLLCMAIINVLINLSGKMMMRLHKEYYIRQRK